MSESAGPQRATVARVVGQTPPSPPPDAMVESGPRPVEDGESDDQILARIFDSRAMYERAEKSIHVKSLDIDITVRELTQRELDDIFEMFEERANPRARGRKRRMSEINAYLVAKALVRPDLTSEMAQKRLRETYGVSSLIDAIPKLFRPLEITAIAEVVLDLSGGGDDAISDAENL